MNDEKRSYEIEQAVKVLNKAVRWDKEIYISHLPHEHKMGENLWNVQNAQSPS